MADHLMVVLSNAKPEIEDQFKDWYSNVHIRELVDRLDPIDAADATFATDNFQAGLLIGQWANATLGADAANAKIALLDLAISQPSVDVLRDQGFLTGMGIDTVDINKWGDETDPRIVGNEVTAGNEEGAEGT